MNQVRGLARALGTRVPSSSTEAFPKRVRATAYSGDRERSDLLIVITQIGDRERVTAL